MKITYRETPLRIAVLMGGSSSERDVSLASGAAVADALQQQGYRIRRIDPGEIDILAIDWSEFDAAFVALHGAFGEDGRIQEILEEAAIPFTGSGSCSSRMAFSKSAAKEQFRKSGVPTPEYVLIHVSDSIARLRSMAGFIGFPLVIKPDQQGSSIGVTIVHSPDQLGQAGRDCFQFGPFGIMERAVIGGGEWTLGLVDARPLPLMKIKPRRDFFDYSAKYEDERTEYTFEFQESDQTTSGIVLVASQASRALATCGIARVDVLVDDAGQPWVIELNTVPGMTHHSLIPKAALHAGISLPELCDLEIRSALRRHQLRHHVTDRCERNSRRVHLRAG